MGKEAIVTRDTYQLESRAFGEQLEVASEREGGTWGSCGSQGAGEKTGLEAERMSCFGQGGFMVLTGDHPRGEGQKTAKCLVWS